MMGIVGLGYAAVGMAILAAVGHMNGLWRLVVGTLGTMLVLAGAWTLLFFFGIAGLLGVARSKHPAQIIRAVFTVAVLIGFVAKWLILYRV